MSTLAHLLAAVSFLTIVGVVLSALGAVIAFYQTGGGTIRDLFRYAFPADLVTRRSCYQDVGFIVLKRLLRPLAFTPFLVTSIQGATWSYAALTWCRGPQVQEAVNTAQFAALVIAAVVIQDFLRFGSHYVLHRFAVLWDIHKVHHSADFLTPLTNHRVHFIEEVMQQALTGLSVGPMLGVSAYVMSSSIATTRLLGFDAYVLLDTLSFAMLRHSHIGLSFGRLEGYLMSPKQHHLHHSTDPRHWNKNFGFLLSCWDRMAGTLHYSDPRERLTFGISPEESRDYDTVLKLHFNPYVKIFWRLANFSSSRLKAVKSPPRGSAPAPPPETVATP